MPRRKSKIHFHEKTCVVCESNFECRRDDKETCGPTCRKRLSRANGEMYKARSNATANTHKQQTRPAAPGAAPGRGGRS